MLGSAPLNEGGAVRATLGSNPTAVQRRDDVVALLVGVEGAPRAGGDDDHHELEDAAERAEERVDEGEEVAEVAREDGCDKEDDDEEADAHLQ